MSGLPGLRAARNKAFLTLDDLAALAGVHRKTILVLEKGRHQPHPTTIRKLAVALGVEPASLVQEPEASIQLQDRNTD